MSSRTPLRRVSQRSLFALSRSELHPDAPHGLGFIEPVIAELADEAHALHANVDRLRTLSDSLRSFNESFASWLYVMDMNALTTDWLQACTDLLAPTHLSLHFAQKRADEDARAAAAKPPSPPPSGPDISAIPDPDRTTNESLDCDPTTITSASDAPSKLVPKKKGKPKLSAKEKKDRMIAIEKVIMCLPLEFRGSDPSLRRNMETVIEFMMDNDARGVKLIEIVRPPDLNQARVNKCLIALVNRKVAHKDSSSGSVLYHWHGLT